MESFQRVLYADPSTGFCELRRYRVGDYFGPMDLDLHIIDRWLSLNIGEGFSPAPSFRGPTV